MNKSKHFSGHPIIKQILKYIPSQIISRTAEEHGSDRYYKRFKTYDHLVTMLFAAVSGVSSLREISMVLLGCEGKISHLNLKHFPKRSTISDANKNRRSAVFASIYYALYNRYKGFLSDSSIKAPLVKDLKIIDSTTISLFSDILKGAGRNPIEGKKKGGIKMHTMIDALEDVPCLIRYTSAATHDRVFLNDLDLKDGSYIVFDKAYNDYTQFLEWSNDNIYFVGRMKDNAVFESTFEYELKDKTTDAVLKDELITVEKDKKKVVLRRVVYWSERKQKCYVFVSNNQDLEPDKIADIYKQRWQIETMFKKLKQNFPLKYFLGDNQNAIEIQIWCALIMQLIMTVIHRKTKQKWAFSNMMAVVKYHLTAYIDLELFLENPHQQWEAITTKPPDRQMALF